MKKVTAFILVLIFAFSLVAPAYCEIDGAIKKLGRGLCNAVTFPLEVPEQMKRVSDAEGPMAGLTYGILKGAFMMCVRAVVGVYETATFPLPIPQDYKPILNDPEFFLENTNY